MSEQAVEVEHRTTPLELFFDLVFVFALTQVTTVITEDTSWAGIGHGLLILTALWWAWASYSWLTNTVDADRDGVLAAMVGAMGAMFVAALAVPEAFGRHGVVFGTAFLIVAVMYLALYALSARDEPELFAAILRIVPPCVLGALLILAAGFVDGDAKWAIWVAALAVGFIGPFLGGVAGWRLAPSHFVERYGLIVIIALGESLLAIGVGARNTNLDIDVIAAALLALLVATAFWLAYFDYFPIRARQLLEERQGAARVSLARDIYSYLHLPMIAGVVLFAFAMKVTLADSDHELGTIPAFALCVGPGIYLLAFVALRLRVSRTLGRGRFIAGIAFIALFPAVLAVPALLALAFIAIVWIGLHAYEVIGWREARAEARALR